MRRGGGDDGDAATAQRASGHVRGEVGRTEVDDPAGLGTGGVGELTRPVDRLHADRVGEVARWPRSSPRSSPIPVALGFHHPALAPAVAMVRDWAEACGLDAGLAEHLAHAICVETVDWPRELTDAVGPDTRFVVDLGPADLSANMTGRALRGRGVTVIPAATDQGSRPRSSPPAPRSPRRPTGRRTPPR